MRPTLALAALPVLLATVPPAAAQGPDPGVLDTATEVWIVPAEHPIRPSGPFLALPVEVRYTAPPGLAVASTEIELRIAEAPPWVVATLSPSRVYVQPSPLYCACVATYTAMAYLLVGVTADAPAFTPGLVGVAASARANGAYAASEGEGAVPVMADYVGLVQAAVQGAARVAAGETASMPLTVQNLGNGPTRVAFQVLQAPEGLQVVAPAPLVLESRAQDAREDAATVAVQLAAAGPFRAGEVVLRLQPGYALDPSIAGEAVDVAFRAEPAPGSDLAVQGLGPASALPFPLQLGLLAAGIAAVGLTARAKARGR